MNTSTRYWLLPALLCVSPASIAEETWRTTWDGTLYGYANTRQLRAGSVLNPGNQIARLAERSEVAELRVNLKAENEQLRLTARPILSARQTHNGFGSGHDTDSDTYFSQWQMRWRASENVHLAAGRDLLNWGPAQFRSPSSPFYFDNGRSDPMRELVGMDSLKASWTPDRQTSVSLVHIVRTGRGPARSVETKDTWRNGWLAKLDRRGDAWAVGLIAAGSPEQAGFFGLHAQTTVSDALMVYGEAGSSKRIDALQSPANAGEPFTVQKFSPRRAALMLGSAYTFENGQSLAAEYLHNGHGFDADQEDAYFARANTSPGIALGLQPPLLGREYVHLVWQSNLMHDQGYWRLMASHNLTDGSSELAAYGEYVINHRMSAYALAVLPIGNARQEFSALFQNSVTLGLKIALP